MHKIMVVDDDALELDIDASLLDRAAIRVFTASSTMAALSLAKTQQPTVVVVGSDARGMGVSEFARLLADQAGLCDAHLLVIDQGAPEPVRTPPGMTHTVIAPDQLVGALVDHFKVKRRASQRVALQVLAALELEGSTERRLGNTIHLGESGMLLEVDQPLALGEGLRVHFFLPSTSAPAERLSVTAVVRNVSNQGQLHYGIEFVELDATTAARIAFFVRDRTGKRDP